MLSVFCAYRLYEIGGSSPYVDSLPTLSIEFENEKSTFDREVRGGVILE